MSKIAIIFPGIGYHTEKPLLYYSKKLAAESGYHVIEVSYSGFESGIKGDPEKMKRAFEHALNQSNKILSRYHFSLTDDLLIISKSVGTVVAGAWQRQERLRAKNIYFTPVEETFRFIHKKSGIVFHGTKDPWVESKVVIDNCNRLHLPLFLTEGANHSMEKGNAIMDLLNMQTIMNQCQSYLFDLDMWSYADNGQGKMVMDKNPDALDKEEIPYLTQTEIQELADKALAYIPKRVAYFARKIGVNYNRITIRNQKTRWGSCSGKGNLNFNCLLMLTPPEVIDYVVVHELCHRKEMNHSKAFWNEVEKILPDYKKQDQWLKEKGGFIMRRQR